MMGHKTNVAVFHDYQELNKEMYNEPESRNIALNKLMNEHKQQICLLSKSVFLLCG